MTDDGESSGGERGGTAPDAGDGAGELRAGDVAVGVPLVFGAAAWLAAGGLGVTDVAVAGATVDTNALGTGLVVAGFLASAVDRALAEEFGVAAAVAAFSVGLAAAYVGRTGGDRGVWVAGGLAMIVSAGAYAYLQFWGEGSAPES